MASWRNFKTKDDVRRYFRGRGISKYRNKQVYINKKTLQMVEKDIYKQIINKLNNKEDWIKFDSMLEAEYFKKLLLLKKAGEIIDIELQPKFELQPAFEKNGKKYRAINYYADFKVTYKDGHVEIIDIKGNVTKEFAIKRKMFEYRYKDLTLKVINKKGEEI